MDTVIITVAPMAIGGQRIQASYDLGARIHSFRLGADVIMRSSQLAGVATKREPIEPAHTGSDGTSKL